MEFDTSCGILNNDSNIFHPLAPAQTILIGRSDGVDVQVVDKRCSRIHAEVAHIVSKSDNTSTLIVMAKGKSPLVVRPKQKNPQLLINGKQTDEAKQESVVLNQNESYVLHEGDEFSLLIDPSAKLVYRFQIFKTPKVNDHLNNKNKSAPPSPKKMEVDSPGNKRKNEEEYDELNISPTKQSKNNHLHQNNHHNNNNHGHVYNNNNNHHAHHQKPDTFYNSEEDEEPQDFKTQNNNMDDYVGANADKVPFVLKPASPKKKSTWNDYRPGPPKKGKIPLPKGNKNCLAGKVFLITGWMDVVVLIRQGILDSLERDEAAQLIEFYGGKVVTGIVLSLTHAVVGSLPGPKKQDDLKKLKDSGKIQILDQSELFELINNSPAISDEDAKQLNSPKKKGGSPSPKKKAPPSPKGKGTNKQGKDKTPPKQDKDNNKDNKKDDNNNSDGDDDNEKRKSKKDKTQREPCMYGVECYRKNFQHRQDFAHPGDADYKP